VGAFYQLVSSTGNCNEIFHKSYERSLYPSKVMTGDYGNFIALKLTPDNLEKFDQSTKDLDISYFLFSNIDFKKIIKFAKKLNLSIRGIKAKDIEENQSEEIDEYILTKEYDDLLKYIDDNQIVIKKLDFFINGNIIKVYDSGIFWINTELSTSRKMIALLKSILNVVVDLKFL